MSLNKNGTLQPLISHVNFRQLCNITFQVTIRRLGIIEVYVLYMTFQMTVRRFKVCAEEIFCPLN